jgi:hypothetical protein
MVVIMLITVMAIIMVDSGGNDDNDNKRCGQDRFLLEIGYSWLYDILKLSK